MFPGKLHCPVLRLLRSRAGASSLATGLSGRVSSRAGSLPQGIGGVVDIVFTTVRGGRGLARDSYLERK